MTNQELQLEAFTADELLAIAASNMRVGAATHTIPLLRSLLERDSSNGRAHYMLAVEQSALGLFGEATQSFERAVKYCPDLAAARLQFAMLLISLGETAKAKQALNQDAPLPPSVAAASCEILNSLVNGDLSRVHVMLDALVASSEADQILVQMVTEFIQEQMQRILAANEEREPRYIGGYARLGRPN